VNEILKKYFKDSYISKHDELNPNANMDIRHGFFFSNRFFDVKMNLEVDGIFGDTHYVSHYPLSLTNDEKGQIIYVDIITSIIELNFVIEKLVLAITRCKNKTSNFLGVLCIFDMSDNSESFFDRCFVIDENSFKKASRLVTSISKMLGSELIVIKEEELENAKNNLINVGYKENCSGCMFKGVCDEEFNKRVK